jgi:hypothetical protein
MSRIILLFHDPSDDDQTGERLNNALRSREAYVDGRNRIGLIQFPDGWLIVCYDDMPDEKIKAVIREKVNAVRPAKKEILTHRTTKERNIRVVQEQRKLASSGNVIAGADRYEYSHSNNDEIYKGLLQILTKSRLADIDPYLESARRETILQRLSILKHRIAHLFLPIDIDLQGWAESGFNSQYGKEIAEEYEGKAKEILKQARSLIYEKLAKDKDNNVEVIVTEALQTIRDDNEKYDLRRKLNKVQELLPRRKENGTQTFIKAHEILFALQDKKKLQRIKTELENGNPFHRWFHEIDKAMEALRDSLPK